MAKTKFNIITSTCVPLPLENVDTDQIIPARFLKATTREEKFFGDTLSRVGRYNPDGSLNKDFVCIHIFQRKRDTSTCYYIEFLFHIHSFFLDLYSLYQLKTETVRSI